MALDLPALAITRLKDAGCLGNQIDVAWHAGEPLVLPIDYYKEAFDRIEDVRPPALHITHHFQTNGTLLSDEFCRFLKARQVAVGVSLDGPEIIHNRNRQTRGGHGTHQRVMNGIRKLQEHEIPFSIIAVLTRVALEIPDVLFNFFSTNGIQNVCFNLEKVAGVHRKTSLCADDMPNAVRQFFVRYSELLRSSSTPQWLREIDGRLGLLFKGEMSEDKLNQPLGIVSVNWKGEFSTFSPELLGVNHPRFGSFIFGNIASNRIDDIWGSEKFRRVNAEIQDGVLACRQECNYFGVCGGGSPALKLAENGTFASTDTVSCRLGIRTITDVLLEQVENISGHLGSRA